MTDLEYRKAAKEFAERWKDKGKEKSDSQKFWIDLLEHVYGVSNYMDFIEFEYNVLMDKNNGWMDGYIGSTKVLIEQKSIDVNLRSGIRQSDGSLKTPFQQARAYASELGYDKYPRWIVTCNFKSFLIYDMNNINSEPEEILLKDLSKEYFRLLFLVDSKSEHVKKEEEVSFKAGEIVGLLYDAFAKQYNDLSNKLSQQSLNELCVRLVFCLYAEDAGLFGRKNVFHDYLAKFEDLDLMRKAMIELFKVLDQPVDRRDPYLEDDLNQFPYVNGGLFSNEEIEIPKFTSEIRDILLAKASDDFDWSEISPTIFGAVFESTLNPETRRAGGMHYTSIENIHKVIDPLFLNDLKKELDEALAYKNEKTRNEALDKFQNHIGQLTFFDPACGSGNFLTETYLSLRRLENEAISAKQNGKMAFDFGDVVKVNINQFYGIEINDFAVKVATTALWIAESQMLKETEKLLSRHLKFLPLKSYTNILEGNALEVDWNTVISKNECNYIMGNPPFLGASNMSRTQKEEIFKVFDGISKSGDLDYVCAWYKIATDYIEGTSINCAFVSTNSITQGEQPGILWRYLLNERNIEITFAHRTFRWDSEASIKAHVHCVIIGFCNYNYKEPKYLFSDGTIKVAKNINGYLVDGENLFIESFSKPLSAKTKMIRGSSPCDNGNFSFTEDEKNEFIKNNPQLEKYIKPYIGSEEFINRKNRYCIWLYGANISDVKTSRDMMEKLDRVTEFRLSSKKEKTRELATTPLLWEANRYNGNDFILIPRVSSEKRKYIPIGFVSGNVVANDACQLVPDASIYEFGILTSNVHNAWMRTIAGRLESRYRYSNLVYNSFIWPNPTEEQKNNIEKTAQMIIDARNLYPDNSLAELYDERFMPVELRKAHQLNDKAVMQAYGFPVKSSFTESDCVAKLMELYQDTINKE